MDAVRAEALGEPVTVTWRATSFVVPPPDDWLLDFSHWAERDRLTLAVEAMLGAEQYEAFRTADPRPKLSELQALIAQVMSGFGLDAGE